MFLTGKLHFPVQVGPPTEYARTLKPWLFGILLVQIALTIWYEVLKFHLFGMFVQAVQFGIGYYAWTQDMNITLVCIFGFVCLINGLILLIMAIIPICGSLLNLNIADTIANMLMPFGNLAGALLARLVYLNWQKNQEDLEGTYARMVQQQAQGEGASGRSAQFAGLFGGANAGHPQYGAAGSGAAGQPLFSGQGFTLGGDPNMANAQSRMEQGQAGSEQGKHSTADDLKETKDYIAADMKTAAEYSAAGMHKAQAAASGMMNGLRESSAAASAAAGSTKDVTHDPFMTQ